MTESWVLIYRTVDSECAAYLQFFAKVDSFSLRLCLRLSWILSKCKYLYTWIPLIHIWAVSKIFVSIICLCFWIPPKCKSTVSIYSYTVDLHFNSIQLNLKHNLRLKGLTWEDIVISRYTADNFCNHFLSFNTERKKKNHVDYL